MYYKGEGLLGDLKDFLMIKQINPIVQVDPLPGFKYSYSLYVDGKSYEQFTESQAKALKTWEVNLGDNFYRIVLGKFIFKRVFHSSFNIFFFNFRKEHPQHLR